MAASLFGDDILAEFYGYDEPAGENPGAPAQAKFDRLKQDGFFEDLQKSDDECDYWDYDDDDFVTEEEQKKMEEEELEKAREELEYINNMCECCFLPKEFCSTADDVLIPSPAQKKMEKTREELEYINFASGCCSFPKELYSAAYDDFIKPHIINNIMILEIILDKIEERGRMGWEEINEVISNAPVCDRENRIKRLVYSKYLPCPYNGLCDLCSKQGDKKHYIEPPWFNLKTMKKNF